MHLCDKQKNFNKDLIFNYIKELQLFLMFWNELWYVLKEFLLFRDEYASVYVYEIV